MQNALVGMYVCPQFQAVLAHGRRYLLKDKTSKQPAGGGRTADARRTHGGRTADARRTAGGGRGRGEQAERTEEVKSENNASNKGNAGKKKMGGNEPPTTRVPNTNP